MLMWAFLLTCQPVLVMHFEAEKLFSVLECLKIHLAATMFAWGVLSKRRAFMWLVLRTTEINGL